MEEKSEKRKFNLKNFLKSQLRSLPLKIVILCFSGGAICVFPFFVLQMKDLGLTINEIAAMYLVIPFASLVGPIVSGLVADKIGKYSLVFSCNIVLATVSYNFLLITPGVPQETVTLNCSTDLVTLEFNNCNDCVRGVYSSGFSSQQITLQNCKVPEVVNQEQNLNISNAFSSDFVCLNLAKFEQITANITVDDAEKESEVCSSVVTSIRSGNVTYRLEDGGSDGHKVSYGAVYVCDILQNVEDCREVPLISKTFILVALIMFVSNFFIAAAFTMMDATILQFVKEHHMNLGKQKIMSMIGFGLAPLLAGFLIDIHAKKIGSVSYMPAFLLSDVLMFVACLTTYFVEMKVDKNESNIMKDLGKLVTSLEVDLFLLLVLILGCNFGFIESYLFIYLQSLNAPNFLLGLTMTVGCLSSIPMLFCADWLEAKIGRHCIFVICFTAYAMRMFGYSFIHNPWMCLIFETLESITYQLMWVTCLRLCPLLSPKGLLATMTGLVGSIHYSFGKGIGGFLGGHLIDIFGLRVTFRIFGGIALAGGIFYLVIHYSVFKKKIEEKEREIEDLQRKEKEHEGKKMLEEKEDKCTAYHEINTMTMELHNSLLTLPSPHNDLSEDGTSFTGSNFLQRRRRKSTARKDSDIATGRSLFTGSVPHLYVADAYELMAGIEAKKFSKSVNNIN